MSKKWKGLLLLFVTICLVTSGVMWKLRQPPYPDNCTEYKRPKGSGMALLCAEQNDTDTHKRFFVNDGQTANATLRELDEVCSSEDAAFFAGCFWSNDSSLFIVTKGSDNPNELLGERAFEAGYDFLKHRPVQGSEFNTLLRKRGGPGPILDIK